MKLRATKLEKKSINKVWLIHFFETETDFVILILLWALQQDL